MVNMDDSAPVPGLHGGRQVVVLTAVIAIGTVAVFWILGFLPWVLDGFHPRDDELWLPVPLLADQLGALVAFTTVGALGAMALPLLFPVVPRPLAVVVAGLVLIATAFALTAVTRSRLSEDPRILDGLMVGVLVLVLVCVLVGGLASFQVGLLPVAAAMVVTQVASWIALLELPGPTRVTELVTVALLAGAFVVSVRRSPAWVAVWPVALFVVWLGPPLSAATTAIAGRLRPGQFLDESLGDVYANGWEVFRSALGEAPRTWWPQVVAVLVGLAWLAVQHRRSVRAR